MLRSGAMFLTCGSPITMTRHSTTLILKTCTKAIFRQIPSVVLEDVMLHIPNFSVKVSSDCQHGHDSTTIRLGYIHNPDEGNRCLF